MSAPDDAAAADERLRERVNAGLEQARILVVDDAPVNCELLTRFLELAGFTALRTAGDGGEALDIAPEFKPDLIILDLAMPRVDGFETCRRLREMDAFVETPVIVQTGLDDPRQRARAFAVGATDLVTKPINRFELVARVVLHLERSKLIDDLSAFRARLEADLAIARDMQLRALPSGGALEDMRQQGFDIAQFYESSDELGGDFWGMRPTEEGRLGFFIADFSGHGLTAALNAFRMQALIDECWVLIDQPEVFVAAVNMGLHRMLDPGQFSTLLAAVFDRKAGRMVYASAASTAPLIRRADGVVEELPSDGLPLGILPAAGYEARETAFADGDAVAFFSDAFPESLLPDDSFLGDDAFREDLSAALGAQNAQGAIDHLFDRRKQRGLGHFTDDATLICVRAAAYAD